MWLNHHISTQVANIKKVNKLDACFVSTTEAKHEGCVVANLYQNILNYFSINPGPQWLLPIDRHRGPSYLAEVCCIIWEAYYLICNDSIYNHVILYKDYNQ